MTATDPSSVEATDHVWVMVGYWKLTDEQIQESYYTQTKLQLGQPELEGPGCLNCETLWVPGRRTKCPRTQVHET